MAPRLRVDHIGIAVKDIAAARERFARILGVAPSEIEEVPSEGVRVSFFDLGGCRIELLEGTGPESPVGKFLEKGRTGVHHVSIRLEEGGIDRFREDLAARGVPVIGEAPRPGSAGSRILFVHPGAADGVLLEFSEHPEPE
jgi:methylmalonyl-CoA/ethylmalonyl-CoA epimerase